MGEAEIKTVKIDGNLLCTIKKEGEKIILENVSGYELIYVKVPKAIMELARDQNYFGYPSERFFTNCIRFGVGSYFNMLGHYEQKMLERKHNVKSELIIYVPKIMKQTP
jgi:hypothetical protein